MYNQMLNAKIISADMTINIINK